MRRAPLLLPLFALLLPLGACDREAPIPDADLLIRVETRTHETELGRAFPLRVVRVWSKTLEVPAFDDAQLSPLVVRLEGTRRREDGTHVEETRRYRAYAFSAKDLVVPATTLRARPKDGGPEVVARSDPVSVHVLDAVDPTSPGAPELPDGPLPEPFPWGPVAGGLLGLLLALSAGLAWARRRRRRPAAPAPGNARSPATHALERLAALGAEEGTAPALLVARVLGASAVVRDYVTERFALPAWGRTREEILERAGTIPDVPEAALARLASLSLAADLVKFAGHVPAPEEATEALADAEAFVRGTGREAAP